VGSVTGADAFCTDGWQFFGADHRLSGEPRAVRTASLPSRRLQYECAVAGLQSRSVELAPDAEPHEDEPQHGGEPVESGRRQDGAVPLLGAGRPKSNLEDRPGVAADGE